MHIESFGVIVASPLYIKAPHHSRFLLHVCRVESSCYALMPYVLACPPLGKGAARLRGRNFLQPQHSVFAGSLAGKLPWRSLVFTIICTARAVFRRWNPSTCKKIIRGRGRPPKQPLSLEALREIIKCCWFVHLPNHLTLLLHTTWG